MGDFSWAELKPAEKVLFVLLAISAMSATLTLIVMVAKVVLEWLNYKKTDELVTVAHDIFLADAQVRADIYKRTQKVEMAAEGTHEAIQDLQKKADKVVQTTEAVKQVVVEGATPTSLPAVRAKTIPPPPTPPAVG